MSKNLRNFDLSVEEIRLMRAIKELENALDNIHFGAPDSPRAQFMSSEIGRLEDKLEVIRENTLIR